MPHITVCSKIVKNAHLACSGVFDVQQEDGRSSELVDDAFGCIAPLPVATRSSQNTGNSRCSTVRADLVLVSRTSSNDRRTHESSSEKALAVPFFLLERQARKW